MKYKSIIIFIKYLEFFLPIWYNDFEKKGKKYEKKCFY